MAGSDYLGNLIGRGRTADVYAWEDHKVVKLFHTWVDEASVAYEASTGRLVYAAGLPVPAVHDEIVLDGRRGIVYERVEGVPLLRQITERPWTAFGAAHLMAALHAQMHAVRAPDLPSLRDRMAQRVRHAPALPPAIRDAALAALDRLPDGDSVCHGDFHPDNILITGRGPVIIDWIAARRGHPLADVARTEFLLEAAEPVPGSIPSPVLWLMNRMRAAITRSYLRRYFALTGTSRADLVPWRLPITAARLDEGIPEERERLLARLAALC
jgi:aminoglycoside phosphotransferase (APT) family kinase protein